METMTAQSVINLAPSTKEQVTAFANQLINDVESGVTNPLSLHAKIIILEKSLSLVKEKIKDQVLHEAAKHNQKIFDFEGCKIEIKELGVKYNYDGCGDSVFEQYKTTENMFVERRKERESFLKSIKGIESILDEETGEVMKICAPIKTSTTGITVTLK